MRTTTTSTLSGTSYRGSGAPGGSYSSTYFSYRYGNLSGTSANILSLNSFTASGNSFAFRPTPSSYVKLRRVSVSGGVQGNRDILWYQATTFPPNSPLRMNKPYETSMEIMFNGAKGLNAGTDNIFCNQGDGNGNQNNIERFDFIIQDGFTIGNPNLEGFVVLDRGNIGGHDAFCVSVILRLDASYNPSLFTTKVLRVNAANYGSVNPVSSMASNVLRKEQDERNLSVSATTSSSQGVGGVFIKYSDLGLSHGTVIYGYSIVASDFPSSGSGVNFVDYRNTSYFPTNTNPTAGGLDLLAISGVFQQSNVFAPIADDLFTTPICNPNGTGQIPIDPLSAVDSNPGGVISSYKITQLPPVVQGILYYNSTGTTYLPAALNTILTPTQATTLKFDPVDGFTGTSAFKYTATNISAIVSDQAVYSIPVSVPPVATATYDPITCFEGTTVVTVDATGGTPPYLGTGLFTRPAGAFSYTVTDTTGCTGVVSGSISQPQQLTATISGTTSICSGSIATVTVAISGGTPPWKITWPGGSNNNVTTSPFSFQLTPAVTTSYLNTNVLVSDAKSCTSSTSGSAIITVGDFLPPSITCPTNISVPVNIGCLASNVSLGTPLTADNCSIATVVNNAPATFPLGTTSVTWTVTDVGGNSTTCVQSVTVTNNIPVANADIYTTLANKVLTGNVLLNDTDNRGQALTVNATSGSTSKGSYSIRSDGAFTFSPNAGSTGTDSFNYTLCDPCGVCVTGTVTINFIPCVEAPLAPLSVRKL